MRSIGSGVGIGRLLGRATAAVLAVYVISLVYRAGEQLIAVGLSGVLASYIVISILRDISYGIRLWEPVEWQTVAPEKLESSERRRATRWTAARRLTAITGGVGALLAALAADLETLAFVLMLGGLPALLVRLTQHYTAGTRPWYPSFPSDLEEIESNG
jgi:hypothetical protein